ncbi:MAG TPA: DUF2809 domain-containing protein [Nakamurella sp.]
MDIRRRRIGLSLAVPVVVAAGLLVHRVGAGWTALLADALYTVLVYLLVALALPRARPRRPAAIAFGISVAIELVQLTDLPARLAAAVPASVLVLGTGFEWGHLIAYAVGAGAAAALDGLIRSRPGRSGSDPRGTPVLDPGQRLGE